MRYFKNTELAKLYHISEKSVRNWIQSAQDGKLDLQLYMHNGRPHVANTSKNTLLIETLVEKGKKFKNSRGLKTISPKKEFYKVYNPKQIFDIISNLSIHHEIPLKYSYLNGGAEYWDRYALRLYDEKSPNILNSTIKLLEYTLPHIIHLAGGDRRVNVIDLGPGNGLPAKVIVGHLLEEERMNRYIAIDISDDMLDIAEENMTAWFGKQVALERYIRDLEYEQFDDLFTDEYSGDEASLPINLVLMFGGTVGNFRTPDRALQAINNSLGPRDLFLYSKKLDTPNSRRYFDFDESGRPQKLAYNHKMLLDFLNISEDFYDVRQGFDERKCARFISIRLKVDLRLNFELSKGTRVVELRKDSSILLWRSWHQNAIDLIGHFERNGFDPMQVSKTRDQEYVLMTSTIKTTDGP